MKKLYSLLVAFIMVFTLSACSNKDKKNFETYMTNLSTVEQESRKDTNTDAYTKFTTTLKKFIAVKAEDNESKKIQASITTFLKDYETFVSDLKSNKISKTEAETSKTITDMVTKVFNTMKDSASKYKTDITQYSAYKYFNPDPSKPLK